MKEEIELQCDMGWVKGCLIRNLKSLTKPFKSMATPARFELACSGGNPNKLPFL